MIYIIVTRSHCLPLLQKAIAEYNKEENPSYPSLITELQRFDISGIPVSRCAFVTDLPPPDAVDVVIEAKFSDKDYCPVCLEEGAFNPLGKSNRSGWCAKHRDRNPERTKRKRKPPNA